MSFPDDHLPKTVQEAVEHMVAALGHDEKELIRTTDEADLREFHFGLGSGTGKYLICGMETKSC